MYVCAKVRKALLEDCVENQDLLTNLKNFVTIAASTPNLIVLSSFTAFILHCFASISDDHQLSIVSNVLSYILS